MQGKIIVKVHEPVKKNHMKWAATLSLLIVFMIGKPVYANDDDMVLGGNSPTIQQIVIEAPADYEEIFGPVDIRIRFDQKNGVKIDLETLEFKYDFFKFDITSRVMRHVNIINNKLFVADADIPPGKHKILVRFHDINGEKHERKFRLHVLRQPKKLSKQPLDTMTSGSLTNCQEQTAAF